MSEMYRWFDTGAAALECIKSELESEGWFHLELSTGHKFIPPENSRRKSAIFVEIQYSTTRDQYRYAQRLVPFVEDERPAPTSS